MKEKKAIELILGAKKKARIIFAAGKAD